MARSLNLSFNGKAFPLGIKKVDRKKIYGYTVVDIKDDNGSKCMLATISDDGKYILSKGCIGYTSLNEKNEHITNTSIKMLNKEGEALEKIPSSFDAEEILLEKTSLDDFLKMHIKSVYQLDPESDDVDVKELVSILETELVLKFKFNYRADYDEDDAVLLQNDGNLFMVIGQVSPFEFVGLEKVIEDDIVDEEDEEDFDFGML